MSQSIRLAVGGIFHETNTYAQPTELTDFVCRRADEIFDLYAGTETYLGGVLDAAREQADVKLIPTLYAEATPSGVIGESCYVSLRDELVAGVATAMPDGVLLVLHGAGVTETATSLEEDLTARLRELLGAAMPMVATLDLHGNIGPRLAHLCTAAFAVREYPHTDQRVCGREALDCLLQVARGGPRPAFAVEPLPLLLPLVPTSHSVWHAINETTVQMERTDPRALAARVLHGFPYADTPTTGASVTVVAHGDLPTAQDKARRLASEVWRARDQIACAVMTPDQAVGAAVSSSAGPIVINEFSDNTGAGAPGDGTFLLRALVHASGPSACFSHVYDPEVVEQAREAGVGATLALSLGGKTDRRHGEPLQAQGTVRSLGSGEFVVKSRMSAGERIDLGPVAAIRIGTVDVVVSSGRRQTLDDGPFICAGLDISRYSIIAVKSSQHFRAFFEPIAAQVLTSDSPGLSSSDITSFPHHHLGRPVWPLDRNAVYRPEPPRKSRAGQPLQASSPALTHHGGLR